ncbi:MAG: TonB-dependent receptor [Chitinophagales bacterium]|nr:TonB-dependent receptor [Chitinophagales bacterium]
MKQYLLLAVAFTAIFTTAYAQNSKITGKVTEESGEGLISANVVIDASKGWAAVTDFDGNYDIKLPGGTYTVTFRYVGKEEQSLKVTVAEGETKTLNVVLKEKQQLIDVVVVTGTKYEQKLGEQTVSMDVIKGTSLTSQNITDMSQGMSRVPGVTIADGQVNIRGGAGWSYGAGSRVQVLIDDLPLLTADAADAKWTIIPMENVDQLEVIKGAASALYGSGALNGIVNIRTAYPVNEPYTKVTVYTGIIERPTKHPKMAYWGSNAPLGGGVNFAHRQKFGQHDLVFGGAYDAGNSHLDSADGHSVRGTVKYRYRFKKVEGLNMGVNVSAYHSWGKTFFFWKGYGNVDIGGGNIVNYDSLAYKPFGNTITQYKSYRFTVDPFVDYYDKKGNHFKVLTRFFNATNTNNTGQGSVPNLYYGEFQYHRKFEFNKFDFNFVAGTVATYNDVNPPKNASNSLFGKNTMFNYSAYAQTDFKFFKKLNISLGARWEYFNMAHYVKDSTITSTDTIRFNRVEKQNSLKDLPYPLFRVGINYQAAEATYLRASFGQGFRYPTIAERYISTVVGPLVIASNPNLKPEKGYSAEFGIKQGFKLGKNWMGFADASFFWNQYDNMMEFTFGQFGPQSSWIDLNRNFGFGFSSQNVGKTRILGTEIVLAGQGKLGPLDIQILTGYNFIDPRSLNWNDTLSLYNYEGIKLENKGSALAAYNQPNGDSTLGINYAMTSTSASNLLKYRNRHTFKFDLTMNYKGLEWNTNMQYASYMENIDYAFVSGLFQLLGKSAFGGLDYYRKQKEATPIGRGRGDIVWNMHLAYNFKEGVRVAFLVKNLLNWEYTPRPAYMEAPRNYQIQLSYTLQNKK